MSAFSGGQEILDVVGVGFGPANLALAIAFEELDIPLSVRFLDKRAGPGWQDGMLLDSSDIQNHPLRDLVTPRNPRSRYSFTNFLHENGRLFEHLNLGIPFPLRIEYAQYVTWVAEFFDGLVDYGCTVEVIEPIFGGPAGIVSHYRIAASDGREWLARSVVVAPGRTCNVPPEYQAADDRRIVHLVDFLPAVEALLEKCPNPRIAVIGGSQSAVEILLDLAHRVPCERLVGINRNFGFRQKDTSPFSDEVYFPGFMDMFFKASDAVKDRLRRELVQTNYHSADKDVLEELYLMLYRNRLTGRKGPEVLHNTEITGIATPSASVSLSTRNVIDGAAGQVDADLVVLATGFKDLGVGPAREPYPSLLEPLADMMALRDGVLQVAYDYRIKMRDRHDQGAPMFLNGLCESSHGMGDAGSFSLLSLRAKSISDALMARLSPGGRETSTAAPAERHAEPV